MGSARTSLVGSRTGEHKLTDGAAVLAQTAAAADGW